MAKTSPITFWVKAGVLLNQTHASTLGLKKTTHSNSLNIDQLCTKTMDLATMLLMPAMVKARRDTAKTTGCAHINTA